MPDATRPTALSPALRCLALGLLGGVLLAGCASAPPVAPTPSARHPAVPIDPPVTPPPPIPPAPPPPPAAVPGASLASALEAADRLRGLSANELQAELARLSALPPTPAQQLQLALGWMQTRQPGDSGRAAQALQRVLQDGSDEARPLHALARLLQSWQADSRRADEQAERQAQQLREAQRRADQLADRLDALRAIERSRPRSSEVR